MNLIYQLIKATLDPIFLLLLLTALGLFLLRGLKNERKIVSVRILFASIFILLYFLSISPVKNLLFYILEKDYLKTNPYEVGNLDLLVVLSGGSYENTTFNTPMPSHETPSRLLHSLQMFNISKAGYLVCSGRGGNDTSDAAIMAQVARRLNISESKIIVEPNSQNTMEHARELNNLLDNKEMNIGLVTSGYHMNRSMREFKKYFKNIIALPSEYYYSPLSVSLFAFIPNSYNFYMSSVAIKEFIGNLWYRIRY